VAGGSSSSSAPFVEIASLREQLAGAAAHATRAEEERDAWVATVTELRHRGEERPSPDILELRVLLQIMRREVEREKTERRSERQRDQTERRALEAQVRELQLGLQTVVQRLGGMETRYERAREFGERLRQSGRFAASGFFATPGEEQRVTAAEQAPRGETGAAARGSRRFLRDPHLRGEEESAQRDE